MLQLDYIGCDPLPRASKCTVKLAISNELFSGTIIEVNYGSTDVYGTCEGK